MDVVFLGLFMDPSHKQDPAFDGSLRSRLACIDTGISLEKKLNMFMESDSMGITWGILNHGLIVCCLNAWYYSAQRAVWETNHH